MHPLLRSRENPQGAPLEEVLTRLHQEIEQKIKWIRKPHSPAAERVMENNRGIQEHLKAAYLLQVDSMDTLAKIAPTPADPTDTTTHRI